MLPAAALALDAPSPASLTPPAAVAWPGNFVARVEALAILETLNADLLSHDSATATLERWCAAHHLASPAEVVAVRVHDVDKPPSAEQRTELGISASEPVRYRRVRLTCGSVVLSEADNWYVPGRLTDEMNTLLDTTDTPFGKVVSALHFRRHTLSARLLWSPLPPGWETARSAACDRDLAFKLPPGLLEHRAVLSLADSTPFSEVVETYTSNILAFLTPLPEATASKLPKCDG